MPAMGSTSDPVIEPWNLILIHFFNLICLDRTDEERMCYIAWHLEVLSAVSTPYIPVFDPLRFECFSGFMPVVGEGKIRIRTMPIPKFATFRHARRDSHDHGPSTVACRRFERE